jgi:hypothetical protein
MKERKETLTPMAVGPRNLKMRQPIILPQPVKGPPAKRPQRPNLAVF